MIFLGENYSDTGGVSEYLLTQELPEELKNKLPDAKQLEDKIRKEIGFIKFTDNVK